MKIGYARVSSDEQSETPQVDELVAVGCERVYREKISGKSKQRPELERMCDSLREGDVVVVQRLDRLGRSLKDLTNENSYLREQKQDWQPLELELEVEKVEERKSYHLLTLEKLKLCC